MAHSVSEINAGAPQGIDEPRLELAGPWRLVWWRFRKHRVALVSLFFIAVMALIAIFCEFVAPFPPDRHLAAYPYAPPQAIHFLLRTKNGLRWYPHVDGYTVTRNPVSLAQVFKDDPHKIYHIDLFVRGEPYKLWNLIPSRIHLFGPDDPNAPMFLLGADDLGQDVLSRAIYGTRVSMSIGLVGVVLSLVFGIILGGVSGYFGGTVDDIIQRVIEFLRSIPTIPLWMGLAAAIPLTWPPLRVYFAITLILSLIGWTTLGRQVRGRFVALKHEDFVTAARLDSASEMRIILHHMVPSFTSHIIATITLAIPQMIISETALSFLGIGLHPPVVSWGVLLQQAGNIRSVVTAPWILFVPAVAVVIAVLGLNFIGDGLRDAADPYT